MIKLFIVQSLHCNKVLLKVLNIYQIVNILHLSLWRKLLDIINSDSLSLYGTNALTSSYMVTYILTLWRQLRFTQNLTLCREDDMELQEKEVIRQELWKLLCTKSVMVEKWGGNNWASVLFSDRRPGRKSRLRRATRPSGSDAFYGLSTVSRLRLLIWWHHKKDNNVIPGIALLLFLLPCWGESIYFFRQFPSWYEIQTVDSCAVVIQSAVTGAYFLHFLSSSVTNDWLQHTYATRSKSSLCKKKKNGSFV